MWFLSGLPYDESSPSKRRLLRSRNTRREKTKSPIQGSRPTGIAKRKKKNKIKIAVIKIPRSKLDKKNF